MTTCRDGRAWIIKRMKPVVVISSCIEMESFRYNGGIIRSPAVAAMKEEIHFIPVCPEVGIGLGVPRASIRLVQKKEVDSYSLVSLEEGMDHTDAMNHFSGHFISDILNQSVDGFILKSGSPSCGPSAVKVYPDNPKSSAIHKKGRGLFADKIIQDFSHLAIEEDDRLRNEKIYDHFLIRIFTHHRFRKVLQSQVMKDLVDFHSNHKYLFMSYNQKLTSELGKITANPGGAEPTEVIREYYTRMLKIFNRTYSHKNMINAMEHMAGYFKKDIDKEEKNLFMEQMEMYRQGKTGLDSLKNMLRQWIARFREPYLSRQVILNPYPPSLAFVSEIFDKTYLRI